MTEVEKREMSTEQYFRQELDSDTGVMTLTMERPDNNRNQINTILLEQLRDILMPELSYPRLRGMVIISGYEKVFSTGADIDGDLGLVGDAGAHRFVKLGSDVFQMLNSLRCMTVSCIAGFALGGGLELAQATDFRISTANARLGQPEINLGMIPGRGGTQRLPRLIGPQRARWMMYSGEPITGKTGQEWGLIDEVVESYGELLPAAQKMLAKLLTKSSRALAAAKRAMNVGTEMSLRDGLDYEVEVFSNCWSTPDRKEGFAAHFEKRKPVWPGYPD